jgi:acyl-CoA synthetase (NDP forming)
MDEMADTLELMTSRRRPTPGGLGVVHDSGGERALLIDTAHTAGVPLADVSTATEKRIGAALDPGLDPANPVDAWGTGRGATDVFAECLAALADDPAVGLVAFCVDLTSEEVLDDTGSPPEAGPPMEAYAKVAAQVSAGTDKPVVVLANLASAADPEQAAALRSAGVPVLEGTLTGLLAIAHAFARRDHPTAAPLPRTTRRPGSAEAMLGFGNEAATLRLLQSYDITTSDFAEAATIDEVLAAAADIGYPVALKTAAPGVVHKSDAGGVVLGLANPQALAAAYADLVGRLGPGALVAEMAPAGLELALGMVRDPSFGSLVVLATGGVLVEAIGRRAVALAPLDLPGAQRLVTALGLDPLLDDLRGVGRLDRAALADTVVRFSELASDLPREVTAVDVNPVIVHPLGCVAVDGVMSTDAGA